MLCFFLASTLMAMITVGGLNSFSILYKELLDFYDTRAGDTAIISSLCIFLNFAIGRENRNITFNIVLQITAIFLYICTSKFVLITDFC